MKTPLTTITSSVALVGFLASLATADIVGFQAESGTTPAGKDGYRVQSDKDALDCHYIDSDHRDVKDPLGDFAVFREYSLTLPAGTYDLWGRIYSPTNFSYDPNFSDDPALNETPDAFNNDSFFVAETFGGDPEVDLDRGNGFASVGNFDGGGDPPRANTVDAYAWINLTDGVDLNGSTATASLDPVTTYTTAGGPVTWTLMSREGGIRHDAFAFVPEDETPTEEELIAAVVNFGDFNIDTVIDSVDFGILRDHLYAHLDGPVSYCDGDIDFDGDVDLYDFRRFKTLFPGAVAAATSVPEPSCLALVLCALAGIAVRGQRPGYRTRQIEN
jgi:hypothetical protein